MRRYAAALAWLVAVVFVNGTARSQVPTEPTPPATAPPDTALPTPAEAPPPTGAIELAPAPPPAPPGATPERPPPPPPAPAATGAAAVPQAGSSAPIAFGEAGQIAITSEVDVLLQWGRSLKGDGESAGIRLSPGLNYFVAPQFSIGGSVTLGYSESESDPDLGFSSTTTTQFGFAVDVGFNLPLASRLSWWFRAGIATYVYHSTASYESYAGESEYEHGSLTLSLRFPLLFHPAEHFFLGIGPEAFVNPVEWGDADDPWFTLSIGSIVGGWF